MNLILVGGFLGSGKTTGIVAACQALTSQGKTVAVVTNDQGDQQVDYAYVKSLGIAGEEVSNGCFCCNYEQLDQHIQAFARTTAPDFIFAEAVGSCTDLLATVVRPLRKFNPDIRVTLCVFADAELLTAILEGNAAFISESVRYIYRKQLEEATILIISKVDKVSSAQLKQLKQLLTGEYRQKLLLFQNSLDAESLTPWLNVLRTYEAADLPSPAVDYEIYGRGESEMAWVDKALVVTAVQNEAVVIARILIGRIFDQLQQKRMFIGHLKFHLESKDGNQKISFTTAATSSSVRLMLPDTNKISILINARVQSAPTELLGIINEVIVGMETRFACRIEEGRTAAFAPGFPRPSYRMEYQDTQS